MINIGVVWKRIYIYSYLNYNSFKADIDNDVLILFRKLLKALLHCSKKTLLLFQFYLLVL